MNNFTLHTPTKMYFGRGEYRNIGTIVRGYGFRKPVIYYGGGSVERSGLLDEVKQSLADAGLEFELLGGVQANPTVAFCEETIEFIRQTDCDMILAVGGGSVLDSAKMASHCVNTGYKPWDITMGKCVPIDSLPVGVILTIAATGSEMSNSAVLTNTELGLKRGFGSDANRPLFTVMSPELTFTLPEYQTACGTVDIMMHTMERYICNNPDNELTDRMAEGLLVSVIAAGERAMANPEDYEARATLMLAGSLSHNGLMGAGRDYGLWAHKLEHEMSGLDTTIAHGAGLAVVWPAYLSFFLNHGLMMPRLCRYATEAWGVRMDYEHPERTAKAGIDATREYFNKLNMPSTLADVGLDEASIAIMSDKCTSNGTVSFPSAVNIGREEVEEIFRLCL